MASRSTSNGSRSGAVVRSVVAALLLGASVVGGAVPAATADGGLTAVLEGRRIRLDEVASHQCHDLEYPHIRCFETTEARDADIESAAESLGLTSLLYVTFYRDENYGGPSYSASNPIPNLGTVGWNDTITSFISENGQRPRFYSDAGYVTPSWRWAAGAAVANVGSGANDRSSSVQNDP